MKNESHTSSLSGRKQPTQKRILTECENSIEVKEVVFIKCLVDTERKERMQNIKMSLKI